MSVAQMGTAHAHLKISMFVLRFTALSTQRVHVNFVCVEVLRPSQPSGVMSSMVSLPNHVYWADLVL